jgi:hypothetical protein
MRSKKAPFIFLAILALITIAVIKFKEYRNEGTDNTKTETVSNRKSGSKTTEVNRNRGFDRRTSFIEYTIHAKCRMSCRHITQEEVEEMMEAGELNYRKSNVKANPCPIYAVEGITKDKQRVRIVFGQCDYKTKVITVIDLEKEWECDCRGDEAKYKNN